MWRDLVFGYNINKIETHLEILYFMLAVERKIYKLQDKNSILELRSNNHEMIEEAQIISIGSHAPT